MSVSLSEILQEIQIGAKQIDPASIKLKEKEVIIRNIIERKSSIYENEEIKLKDSSVFRQGSYAIDTAIKHKLYDVDADLGILFDTSVSEDIRIKVFNALDKEFKEKKPTVTFKKPCIEIDFKDGYCVDVAIYSESNGKVLFHNSINGSENFDLAKPQDFIAFLQNELANDTRKRKIIRLLKHFNNVAFEKLDINEDNKIPSIAITLFIISTNIKSENLDDMVLEGITKFRDYVKVNGINGPSLQKFCIGNTFYKVKDISQILTTIDMIYNNVVNCHYSELISESVFKRIQDRKNKKTNPSIIGTLGNG